MIGYVFDTCMQCLLALRCFLTVIKMITLAETEEESMLFLFRLTTFSPFATACLLATNNEWRRRSCVLCCVVWLVLPKKLEKQGKENLEVFFIFSPFSLFPFSLISFIFFFFFYKSY